MDFVTYLKLDPFLNSVLSIIIYAFILLLSLLFHLPQYMVVGGEWVMNTTILASPHIGMA